MSLMVTLNVASTFMLSYAGQGSVRLALFGAVVMLVLVAVHEDVPALAAVEDPMVGLVSTGLLVYDVMRVRLVLCFFTHVVSLAFRSRRYATSSW